MIQPQGYVVGCPEDENFEALPEFDRTHLQCRNLERNWLSIDPADRKDMARNNFAFFCHVLDYLHKNGFL